MLLKTWNEKIYREKHVEYGFDFSNWNLLYLIWELERKEIEQTL